MRPSIWLAWPTRATGMICWRGSLTTLHASATWSVCAGRRASRAVLRHCRRRVVADGRRRAPLQGVPGGDVGDVGDVGENPGRDKDAAGQLIRSVWCGASSTSRASARGACSGCCGSAATRPRGRLDKAAPRDAIARSDRDLDTPQGQRHAAKPSRSGRRTISRKPAYSEIKVRAKFGGRSGHPVTRAVLAALKGQRHNDPATRGPGIEEREGRVMIIHEVRRFSAGKRGGVALALGPILVMIGLLSLASTLH